MNALPTYIIEHLSPYRLTVLTAPESLSSRVAFAELINQRVLLSGESFLDAIQDENKQLAFLIGLYCNPGKELESRKWLLLDAARYSLTELFNKRQDGE